MGVTGGFIRRCGRFRAGENGGGASSGFVAESSGMPGQVESIGILPHSTTLRVRMTNKTNVGTTARTKNWIYEGNV